MGHRKFKEFIPRWAERPLFSLFVVMKTLIGVLAFKTIETALHVTNFETISVASLVTLSILVPIFGLSSITEELD
jgi:hypothetical protein